MNKNFKEEIDIKLSNIKIEDKMKDKILKNKKKIRFKRPIALACSVCVFMLISVPVLAAALPAFNELIEKINPKIAEILSPINKVIESNGIKIEVLGSANDSETMLTYITVKDVEQDRIDSSVEFYRFKIREGDYVPSNELIEYNKETKTATFLLISDINKVKEKKISLELESILGKNKQYKFNTLLDINNINKSPESINLDMKDKNFMASGSWSNYIDKKNDIKILKPNMMNIPFKDTDIVSISNIGIIDGKLHIQLKWKEHHRMDNGYLSLVDKLGNFKDSFGVSFGLDKNGAVKYGEGLGYSEHIMDLDNYDDKINLRGEFTKYKNEIKGEWKIPVSISENTKEENIPLNENIYSANVKNIKITPIGFTLTGDGDNRKIATSDISMIMKDGSIKEPKYFYCNFSKPEWKSIYYYFGLDIDNIKEIIIGEHKIKVD